MSSKTIVVSTSITQAIAFLTRPLILTHSADVVNALQSVLRTTLTTCFDSANDAKMTLSLSSTSLPPRPVFTACIAAGLHWGVWMELLGGRDFHLVIEPCSVVVVYLGPKPQTVVVWLAPSVTPASRALLTRLDVEQEQPVPISKLGRQQAAHASLRSALNSAVARRTPAQKLLEVGQKAEADEIFAMISKISIVSPTPMRNTFPFDAIVPITTPSFSSLLSSSTETSSPASSRPSSRSSDCSAYSFSSSDGESVTTASSASSYSKKPTISFMTKPTPLVSRSRKPPTTIDDSKKHSTKYLYKGGASSVLTGGVMLGGGSLKSKPISIPKAVQMHPAQIHSEKSAAPLTQNSASAVAPSRHHSRLNTFK